MAVQSIYNDDLSKAIVGQISDMEPSTVISRTLIDISSVFVRLETGKPVTNVPSDDYSVTHYNSNSSTNKLVGIVALDRSLDNEPVTSLQAHDELTIMTKGVIWVRAGGTISAGQQLRILSSSILSNFYVADVGKAVPRGYFVTSATVGQLVAVRLS